MTERCPLVPLLCKGVQAASLNGVRRLTLSARRVQGSC